MTTLFIIESTRLVREGIKSVLIGHEDIRVAGESYSIQQAMRSPEIKYAKIILLEVKNLPNGFPEAFRLLRETYPEAKIICHSLELLDARWLKELVSQGMKGYLTKNVSNNEIYYAIQQVAGGGLYFTPAFTLAMLNFEKLVSVATDYVINLTLSEHELATLKLVADGYTNRDIAAKLSVKPRTVEARRKALLKKTSTRNTAALVKYAVQFGLL